MEYVSVVFVLFFLSGCYVVMLCVKRKKNEMSRS